MYTYINGNWINDLTSFLLHQLPPILMHSLQFLISMSNAITICITTVIRNHTRAIFMKLLKYILHRLNKIYIIRNVYRVTMLLGFECSETRPHRSTFSQRLFSRDLLALLAECSPASPRLTEMNHRVSRSRKMHLCHKLRQL